jgi:hypothetical protein
MQAMALDYLDARGVVAPERMIASLLPVTT